MKESMFKKLSLQNRIALHYMIATATLLAIVFAAIYLIVMDTVYLNLNGTLVAEAGELLKNIDFRNSELHFVHPEEWKEKEHVQLEVDPIFIQIVGRDGSILKKTENLFDEQLMFHPDRQKRAFFNDILAGSRVRQIQVPIHDVSGQVLGYLIVAIPLRPATMVLDNLRKVLILSFPVILVILFWFTRFVARESLRPVNRIIETAEKITQTNLDERVPLPQNRDELYRLTSTINRLLDRLQDALQREKQFTADASHELRTPLAAVKGTLEVLIRRPRERDYYEQKIRFCIGELDRLAGLVEHLLMLARFDNGGVQPRFQAVDLELQLRRVIERLQPQARRKTISIHFEAGSGARVQADPSMLDIIFENLLSNAIKFSPEGSAVDIGLEEREDRVVCRIIDHGFGMPEEQAARVFDRFYRGDPARSSQNSGFGLGLAIVKKLTDLQGIDISLTSQVDKGTTVCLYFPAVRTEARTV